MAVQRLHVALVVLLSLVGVDGGQQMVERRVGCRFSNSICSDNEECVDDGLFGNCQSIMLPKDTHRYKLMSEQLQELEGILQFLIDKGYNWRHKFTQCVLLSTLLAYRYHFQLNLEYCDPKGTGSFPHPAETYPQSTLRDGVRLGGRGYSYSGYGNGREWEKQDGYLDLDSVLGDRNEKYNRVTYQKRYYDAEGMQREREVGGVDDFLNNLSSDELDDLKEFLVEEENAEGIRHGPLSPAGRVVKKSPAMMTNVVVKFTPEDNDNTDAEAESEANENEPELSQTNGKTAEQMLLEDTNQQSSQPPAAATNEQTPEKVLKVEYPGQYRTGLSQNPIPMVMPGAGSQMALTTIIPSALAKDNALVKLEPIEMPRMSTASRTRQYLITMYVLCGIVGIIIAAALVVYVMRRHAHLTDKISKWAGGKGVDETTSEYQDLCRQHMQAKLTEKAEPVHKSSRVEMISTAEQPGRTTSTGSSSTSSWTEEPVSSSMDISTGHIILSYMEDHLTNKDRLQKEWDSLSAYDAEPCSIVAAIEPTNMRKNRYTDILPYEHSRVKLNPACNVSGSDYINACTITDHDPRNPAYIAAQGPLPHTVADFWQMVWEQGSVVIVNLTRLTENTISVCHRYWPEEGSDLYHIYEVHLVSEHAWCDDYVVRSFFLKNLQTNETRTITQFHFLTWPNLGIPSSTKTLLDFRRKVNKSYRGRSCPIVVHCSDGAGRTGTYCLIDMALNRLHKGAKEIDIAATLEHIRDQRVNMVRTKEQFEFALAAVAEEVHAIVHVPPPPPTQ